MGGSSKSTITLTLDVDSGGVKTGLAKVREEFASASKGISTALSSIKGFADLKKQTMATSQAYGEVQKKVAELARAVKSGVGGAALAKDFEQAKREAARLKDQLAGQQQQLQVARNAMAAAGLSTKDLAGQQAALRGQLESTKKTYQDLAAIAQARTTLNLTPHADIAAEIGKAKAAYVTLAASGKLSMAELAQAKVALGTKIDELKTKTNGWKEAMVGVKSGMLEMAAAAAPTVLAIGQAIKFESSMANVKKVVEATPAGFSALRSEILGLTREIPLTANELAQIATAGGQLGIASQDIGSFVTVTAKMATAFDMTAEEAGNSIGKIRNVYQLAIGEVESLGDTINRLGNTSAAREKDIVEVMLRVGGTAKQFGLAKEQTAALSAAMLSLGKTPEVASTSINAMLNRMQTATMQSGEFHTALGKIGMSAQEMAAQVAADPQKALDALLETLGKLSGQQRSEVLTGLFGREFQDDIGVLVGSLQTYKDAMGQVADRTSYAGSMNKEFEERAKTTENQLQLLRNAVNEAGINLGSAFLPAVRAIIAPFTTIIRLLADMAAAAPNLSAVLVSVGTGAMVFGQVARLAGIAKMAIVSMAATSGTAFQALRAQVTGVGGAVSALGPAMMAAAVGWEIGTWLNKFDIVKKAGLTTAHALTMAWLKVKQAWEWVTGGDTAAVEREMDAARQAYSELMAEVDAGTYDAKNKRVAAEEAVTQAVKESAQQQEQATKDALGSMADGHRAYAEQVNELEKEMTAARSAADLTAKERALAREERGATDKEHRQGEAEDRGIRIQGIDSEISRYESLKQEMSLLVSPSDDDKSAAEEVERKLIALRGERIDLLREEAAAKRQAEQEEEGQIASLAKAHENAASQQRLQAIELDKVKASGIEDERARIEEELALDRDAMAERIRMKKEELAELHRLEAAERDDAKKVPLRERILEKETEIGALGVESSRQDEFGKQALAAVEERERQRREEAAAREEEQRRSDEKDRLVAEKERKKEKEEKKNSNTVQGQRSARNSRKAAMASRRESDQGQWSQQLNANEAKAIRETTVRIQEDQAKATEERMAREQAATEKAKSIFERYADRVRSLQEEISGRERSLREELAEMDPNADEETKWQRRAAEAKKYEKSAREALKAGRLGEAKDLADQAREAYRGLSGGAEGVDEKYAKQMAYAGVQSAGQMGLDIAKMLPEMLKKSVTVDLSKLEGINAQAVAMMSGKITGATGSAAAQPTEVHEIRLGKASLQGSPADVGEFLRQLETAGLSA